MADHGPSPLGKLRRLAALADYDGRFQVLSADRTPGELDPVVRAAVLDRVVGGLSGQASGVVLDPARDLGAVLLSADRGAGLLATLDQPEARSLALLPGWSVAKAVRCGAAGVVVRLEWSADHDSAPDRDLLTMVGDECAKHELPLLAEVRLSETEPSVADRARLVAAAAAELSAEELQVDLLALPLPGSLLQVAEDAAGTLDGVVRAPVQTRAELAAALDAVDRACRLPWLLRGEGGFAELAAAVELSAEHGASGFVCGGASWHEAVGEELGALDGWLARHGLLRWRRLVLATATARPWFEHPRHAATEPPAPSADWYRGY